MYAERVKNVTGMSKLLDSTARDYTFGHLVFTVDKNTLKVCEDNLIYAESRLCIVTDNAVL